MGEDIVKSLTPGQQVIKIVNEELTGLMGGSSARLTYSPQNRHDLYAVRPAGRGQNHHGWQIGLYVQAAGQKALARGLRRVPSGGHPAVEGRRRGRRAWKCSSAGRRIPWKSPRRPIEHARYYGRDMVIIDTAGRLHIDEKLMQELRDVRDAVKPQEILLVVDAMTGQDAVNVSDTFNRELGIDGIILTKLDGDTRGGAAISVKAVTGKPIKLVGTGEKLAEPEIFHPDRMASRILGMGDVLSLIEKAESTIDEKAAMSLERKMRTQSFTLEDYLEQMKQLSNMGSISDVLKMIPGVGSKLKDVQIDEDKVAKAQKKNVAIILSMTRMERRNPDILNASRKRRIAAGSGATVQDVNLLLKQFDQARSMMKQVMGMRGKKRMRLPFGMK